MFGGGNKQNLSAKVISTANGSSVVEVAGNVIDVGGVNELENSMLINMLASITHKRLMMMKHTGLEMA